MPVVGQEFLCRERRLQAVLQFRLLVHKEDVALSSLKGISMIQTPPEGRLPVKVTVAPRKDNIIKEAIEAELKRKGQVYLEQSNK